MAMSGFMVGILFKIMQFALLILVLYFLISLLSKRPRRAREHSGYAGSPSESGLKWVGVGCGGCLGVFLLLLLIGFSPIFFFHFYDEITMPDIDRQIREIEQQQHAIEHRIEEELPDFVRLLYTQVREIKEELKETDDPARQQYLMEELDEIARIFLVLDKEEDEFHDLLSELSSNKRSLVRLRESEKIFGPEYEEYMEQSREAMIKSRAKLNIKLNEELGNTTTLSEAEVQQKIEELLK